MRTMTIDKEIRDREKIAREIAKTSESIRKKHRALKTGKMDEDIALERHFKPIIEPLRKIAENTIGEDAISNDELPSSIADVKNEMLPFQGKKHEDGMMTLKEKIKKKRLNISSDSSLQTFINNSKRKRLNNSLDVSLKTSTPTKSVAQQCEIEQAEKMKLRDDDDDIFETTDDSLVTSLRRQLQTSEGENMLRNQLGPLGQKYIGEVLRDDKDCNIDSVYGVYFEHEKTMLGDKCFDVDKNDNIIINGVRYIGTPGLYELIFKRLPDDTVYTEDDKQKYKSILLTTNAHRRNHNALNPILGNKGYKYKHVIAPLLSMDYTKKKTGRGSVLPHTMVVTDNKIDYVHWNDPNELVDRLRLLDSSHQAGNNSHDNEILSIIEELREAGLIIN